MKIEEGGYYRNRQGDVAGPANPTGDNYFPWEIGTSRFTEKGSYYHDEGESSLDLVSRVYVYDEPAEAQAAEPDWHEVRVRLTASAFVSPNVYTAEGAVQAADRAIRYMKENPL